MKVDLEKFICSLLKISKGATKSLINDALKEQGFRYDGQEIVENRPILPIEIPFEAFDSELMYTEWRIPEGYAVKIENRKVIISKSVPKFKVGDWIIADSDRVSPDYRICKITEVKDGKYGIESTYGCKGYNTFEAFDKDYRLWTVYDLKNGDVIAVNDQNISYFQISIFKENTGTTFSSHCHYNYGNVEFVTSIPRCTKHSYLANIHPATYEQRKMLFIEMGKAGYMWDSRNLELQKIVNK